MAIPNNQAIMVLHQEGTTTSTLVPQTSACSLFVVVNQLHPGGGRQDKQALFASTEISSLAKPTIGSCVSNFNKVSSMSLSAMAPTNTRNQLCNLPAESTCKGITVTLDNNNMWNEFFRCQTEMILTKQGRRMFPCCRFRISGLEPFQRYTLVMDMHPVDNYRYKWSDGRWETNGKSDPHILRSFVHPDSPATGLDWMQNPVSFYKLKLTNNPLDREGHIIVNSMHRYIPRLHIIPADKAVDVVQLDGPDVVMFNFSQTEFFAVTAYQNLSITQLKIDYNPFAKGFRDDANNSRCSKPKSSPSTEKLESEVKSNKEATALNNLKSLLAKMNASEKVTTNGDLKTVHCDGPRRVEPESSSSSTKRPWPGGLSDLIKGAHVKVKRISLEKIHNGNSQQVNIESMASKENNVDVTSKDCTSENISIPDVTEEEMETVSFSKKTSSSALNNSTELLSATNMQCKLNRTSSSTPLNEKVATILSETATLTDEKLISEETSKSVVKPLDCGVKKKRAEPVPLPLLALFLQQLKSKTRPTRPKSKSENCSLASPSDKSCHDLSVAENLSSSTVSVMPSLDTQLNVQPAASPKPQTITSSILTSTEDETVSTLKSASDCITASTASVVHDELQLSAPKKVPATTSAFAHIKPNTSLSDTTPDTNLVSVALDKPFSDCEPSCDPKAFPATTPDAPNSEVVNSNVNTDKSTTEPAHDSCTLPCSEPIPEAVPQSPSPRVKILSSPSCAPSSPYMSAPSSPDPFPPSMFSDRPIPPRKALDPFPPCLSLDRPRPLLEPDSPLTQIIFTRPTRSGDRDSAVLGVTSVDNCPSDPPVVSPDPCIPKELKQSVNTSKGTKCKVKQKKGKSKLSEDTEVMEGPVPVPMQPSLEDVEGQLFVSFMSKKALEIHLGDETKEEILPKTTENNAGEVHDVKKSIEAFENVLLRDLKNMKYRQVIHPVLQAVGLKLNLLDVTLSIDLQYLGVCLPIPPPILSPEGSSGTCSSQVHFVSRTGKTSDITKIKGWREKFSTAGSSSVPGVTTSLDTGQKNLSAFCSDMLDEYLESEGKLIDERAASFSQAVVTPVAYQLPTKSTSYVRTLDSVLKKQATPLTPSIANPSSTYRKTALTPKSKTSVKSGVKSTVSSTNKKSERSSLKKSAKSETSRSPSSVPPTTRDLSQSKKASKIKTKKGSKTSQHFLQTAGKPVKERGSVATEGQNTSSTPGSNPPVGRSSGLPKTLVKLRDVEDGAVWEGKNRTYITMERAAIALSCLVTAEGMIGGNPSTVIKRRAPPCLNDFCRLGCVCASLVQERRQHHCGKPQCMLRCDCLRRKVVLLKNEDADEGSSLLNHAEENGTRVKKKKNRISYFLSGPDAAPEPALHVKTLWLQKNSSDSEQLYIPEPARPLHPQAILLDLQKDLENFLHHSPEQGAVDGEGLSMVKNQESLDCARVRPFCGRKLSPCRQGRMKDGHPDLSSLDALHEMEEGELRPPTQSGATKRLEIVSNCKWATEGSRNVVLRTVCERMAQDRLKHPFWVSKYQIQPTSKTVQETDEGSITTYKVIVSQPHLKEIEEKKRGERIKQLETQLIETIGKSEVKGLPLLSQVTPAGLLKADKKPSGALGQIMVNGKLYPQAKLELGQMGALHPANRLAAYITGRVCVANKHEAKIVTSHTAPTTPTSVTTTTTTSTLSSTSDKPSAVAKHHTGTEFVQLEISRVSSQQQKTASTTALPMQSTGQNLIIPSSSMLTGSTGISVSPNLPPKASVASLASPGSTTTDGSNQVVKAVPGSGSAAPENTFVLSTAGSDVALSGSRIRFMQPLPPRAAVPGQRMVMLKAANPAGQVIHLVPLGQFRALNPNILVRSQQSTLIRLPASNPVSQSKLQTSTTVVSNTTTPSATQAQNMTPVLSAVTKTVITSTSSPAATAPVTPLSGAKTLLFCNKPSTVKIVPGFLSDTATNSVRILPQVVFEESKIVIDPRITSMSLAQSSSEDHPANQGLQLTSQSCLTPKNEDPPKLDNLIYTSSTPTKESCKEDSQCSKMSADNVIFTDHSYTFEIKKTSIPSKKPVDVFKDSSDPANGSTYHMLLKEVLDLGLVEEVEDTSGAVLGVESGNESKAGSHLVEEEDDSECTELTEDSDMYNDTDSNESSGDEDLCFTDSDGEEKKEKQDSVDAEVQVLTEKDDDELVDIETFEEGAEKSPAPPEQIRHDSSFQNQSSDKESGNMIKLKKRKDEKKRRILLRNCFHNLQQTLKIEESKVPKITVLSEALEEIHALSKRRDRLVKMRDKLNKKRANYLEMASQLSGKNKESISQKLNEIIAKQKSLEINGKANDTSPNHEKRAPMHSQRNVKTRHKKLGTSKAEHLSTSKPKHLRLRDRRTEDIRTNQKTVAAKPSQPASQPASQPNSCPTPQLRKRSAPIPGPRVRTRPNILSHNKSQTPAKDQVLVPQVIPMMEAVVPCNQIITLSNPLQPIDLTSLRERQSTTPGVAAVSICVPPISHPLCVENPLPKLQPQVHELASSPVIKPASIVSLPRISGVSLVESVKLLVTPPTAAGMQTQAACTAEEAQKNPSSDEAILVEEEDHLDKQLPEVVAKIPEHDAKVDVEEDPKKQKDDKYTPQSEQDDDHLMSLLDELVFLNQTSEPQEAAPNLTESDHVLTELLTNKEAHIDRDDERSLSPLFLKLDEDIIPSPTSKEEEMDDIPPKVDDLVKVIFGSESPSNSSESEIVPAASDDGPRVSVCHVKHDAPTPPPLLQMKTGGCTTADSPKEQASLSWRPMPKLAPLGLKIQETGYSKLVSPHAHKSD